MSGHTKGPWRIDTNGGERWSVDFEGPSSSYVTICGDRKEPIAFAVEPKAYGGPVDANARVIAAAPCLLAALKALAEHTDAMEAQHQDYHGIGDTPGPIRSQPLNDALALIAKATAQPTKGVENV